MTRRASEKRTWKRPQDWEAYPDRLVSSPPPPEPTTTISNAGMRMWAERTKEGNGVLGVRGGAKGAVLNRLGVVVSLGEDNVFRFSTHGCVCVLSKARPTRRLFRQVVSHTMSIKQCSFIPFFVHCLFRCPRSWNLHSAAPPQLRVPCPGMPCSAMPPSPAEQHSLEALPSGIRAFS